MSDDRKLLEDCKAIAEAMQRILQRSFPEFELSVIQRLNEKLEEVK